MANYCLWPWSHLSMAIQLSTPLLYVKICLLTFNDFIKIYTQMVKIIKMAPFMCHFWHILCHFNGMSCHFWHILCHFNWMSHHCNGMSRQSIGILLFWRNLPYNNNNLILTVLTLVPCTPKTSLQLKAIPKTKLLHMLYVLKWVLQMGIPNLWSSVNFHSSKFRNYTWKQENDNTCVKYYLENRTMLPNSLAWVDWNI